MTMADTVAVMNAGRIEQLGSPEELYERPATTFVANFLGQSNLVSGRVAGREGDRVVLDVHGQRVAALADAVGPGAGDGEVWVGVRPEKVVATAAGAPGPDGCCTLPGGTVTDVSFVGVSTQYLVRMPWGQELTVFAQNDGSAERLAHGADVDLHWRPGHTFLLDAAQDASAGVQREGA